MRLLASTNYDIQLSSPASQISRKFYVTESNDSNLSRDSIYEVTEENTEHNIDASAITLLINMCNQSPNTCMPKEDLSSLGPEVRQIWSKIPNDTKAVMLRSRTGNLN